jgi:DNA-binding NarL/FixJ family response regulator
VLLRRRDGYATPPCCGKVRLVVCEDHVLFLEGVVEMYSFGGDVAVVGEAAIHEETVAVVSDLRPDVVLLDLEMPGGTMGADESMGHILDLSPPPRVVVFTMHDEPGMVGRFLRKGATAYIPKSAEMNELVEAVRDAARLGPESRAETEGGAGNLERG